MIRAYSTILIIFALIGFSCGKEDKKDKTDGSPAEENPTYTFNELAKEYNTITNYAEKDLNRLGLQFNASIVSQQASGQVAAFLVDVPNGWNGMSFQEFIEKYPNVLKAEKVKLALVKYKDSAGSFLEKYKGNFNLVYGNNKEEKNTSLDPNWKSLLMYNYDLTLQSLKYAAN